MKTYKSQKSLSDIALSERQKNEVYNCFSLKKITCSKNKIFTKSLSQQWLNNSKVSKVKASARYLEKAIWISVAFIIVSLLFIEMLNLKKTRLYKNLVFYPIKFINY